MTEINWYALYVNSRSEKKVFQALTLKGVESYLPLIKIRKQWSDRKKTVEEPLFTGYVFIKILPEEKQLVLQTKGVVGFVKTNGQIAVVKEHEIGRLKQLIELGYQIESERKAAETYDIGNKVKIKAGILKNIEGSVLENKDGKFILIQLDSIGYSIKVKLPEEILTRV